MLVVDSEAEFRLNVRLECRHDDGQWLTSRVLDRTIVAHRCPDPVATVICNDRLGKSAAFNLSTLEVVHLETNSKLVIVVLAAHLHRELDVNVDRFRARLCIDSEFHLRVEGNCIVIGTTASCGLGFAPFRLKEDLCILIVEEATKEQLIKVHVEVIEGHPEDSIMLANLIDPANLLFHSLVSCLFPTLVPFVRLVTPGTVPLGVFSPGVPKLDQIVSVDSCHVENAIGVALDNAHR